MSNALESQRSEETPPDRSITAYAEIWDLHPHFLPVPRRKCDEWELFDRLKTEIYDLRPTQQSFKISDMLDKGRGQDSALVQTYLWTLGSYPVEPEICESRWANPRYCHGDEHQNPGGTWQEHVEKAAELPTIQLKDVAARFDMSRSELVEEVHRNDIAYQTRAEMGTRRLARTVKTTVEWSDYELAAVGGVFPKSKRTVRRWVNTLAEDFDPPEMPTNSNWTPDPTRE